jgi:hypothetical protein
MIEDFLRPSNSKQDADQRLVALFAGKAGRLRWKELVA